MLRYERVRDDIEHLVSALKHALGDDLAPTPPPNPQSTPMALFAAVPPQPAASAAPNSFFHGKAALLACGRAAIAGALPPGARLEVGAPDVPAEANPPPAIGSTSQPGWCQDPNLK